MADFGYDVADYCDVDPRFGTLAELDALLAEAHARGIRVILDFVPNHTSEEHPWFQESRASRASRRRAWYIWRDGAADGGPPNNWISDFGGSAWEWDEPSGQFYYHAFLKQQPDLDWRNPEVQAAMLEVMRFWFARGVDGLRIDVLWHLIKAEGLPDNPVNPEYAPSMGEMYRVLQAHSTDQPEVHAVVREMRRVADEYGGRLLIGEIYLPFERLVRYYGDAADGVQLPANFSLIEAPWRAEGLAKLIGDYEAALPAGAWPSWVLGNHDRPRVAARVGDAQARVAAMLLLTLRGTPFLYYGDELGIGRVEIPADRVQDPRELCEPGLGLGRDPVRSPMPWDGSANAGFSTGSPWLPLNADWAERNVATQAATSGSLLNLYRRLRELRRAHDALSIGAITLLETSGDVLAYSREAGEQRLFVALNLGDTSASLTLPPSTCGAAVLLSTLSGEPSWHDRELELRPNEGLILGPLAEPRDP